MKQMRQLPDAVGQARRRPGVVRVAVHGHRRARQRELRRTRGGLPDVEAARPDRPRAPARAPAPRPSSSSGRVARRDPERPRRRRARSSREANARRRTAGRSIRQRRCVSSAARGRKRPPARSCRASRPRAPRRARRRRAATRESERTPPPRPSVRGSSDRTSASTGHADSSSPLETAQTAHRSCVTITSGFSSSISAASTMYKRAAVANRRADRLVDLQARQARRVDPRGGHDRLSHDPGSASDTPPRHRRENRSAPDRRSSPLHWEGTNKCALRLDSRQT